MNAEQYRALVNKLESIQQLNELAYGQEDPNNPGFMWVPADGTTPLGDGSKQMIRSGSGGYWNAKKVPIVKPEVAPAVVAPAVVEPEKVAEPPAVVEPEKVAEPPAVVEPEKVAEPPAVVEPEKVAEPPAVVEPEKVAEKEPEVFQPQIAPTKKLPCDPDTLAKIKYMPSFNKAFAAARAAGCEKFDWCGVYTTQVEQAGMDTIPAAVGNPTVYAQGINMAVNRAKLKGVLAQSGPYTQKDVAKVVKGLQDGTIGYQLDPKSHSTSEIETFTRMLRDQLLKGDKRASGDFKTPLDQRTFPAPKK